MKAKDVKYVFKQNPELKDIGTRTQYFKYLKTIFPESKEKNILYHATKTHEIQKDILDKGFDFLKIKNKLRGEGLSIATTPKFTKGFGDYVIPLITDVKNYESNLNIQMKNLDEKNFDLITDYRYGLVNAGVITKPENIYILGSEKDKKAFNEFVLQTQKDSLEKRLTRGFFTFIFLIGLIFSTNSITGNVIGISSSNFNFHWPILSFIGLCGFYITRKYKK